MKSKEILRREAIVRDEARAKRSDKDQLDRITANGHGHSREADRLRKRIAEAAAIKAATTTKPAKKVAKTQ